MRPIKGVCFETLFDIILKENFPAFKCIPGTGDSDVDLTFNEKKLQLKTPASGPTKIERTIGVSLHKTHGDETRPNNLYRIENRPFDFLVVLHPSNGVIIVPLGEIPENTHWQGYLADPAIFKWDTEWLNRWDLLGFPRFNGQTLENRKVPEQSEMPKLSAETYLEDYQIIETLCKPEYFRAAVMGLKGNIKEQWIKYYLNQLGYSISEPTGAYQKYDLIVENNSGDKYKIQIKGTSKNMCNPNQKKIGVEVMGTHGQFPKRGYKKSYFDYLCIIISENQLGTYSISPGLHFVFIPVSDLPLHYLIGEGGASGINNISP